MSIEYSVTCVLFFEKYSLGVSELWERKLAKGNIFSRMWCEVLIGIKYFTGIYQDFCMQSDVLLETKFCKDSFT